MKRLLLAATICLVLQAAFLPNAKSACADPVNVKVTHITCDSVIFTWVFPPVPTPMYYEYCVDLMPTSPIGPFNVVVNTLPPIAVWTNLMPNFQYYVHIRGICGTSDKSAWVHVPFKSAKCALPQNIAITTSDTQALVKWQKRPCAKGYEYSISTTSAIPTVPGTYTTADSANFTGLVKGGKYYVFIRSVCDSAGHSSYSSWHTGTTFPLDIAAAMDEAPAITVYPNPATDVLYAEIAGTLTNGAMLQLLGTDGRLLLTQQVTNPKTSINTSQLASGLYYLRYSDGTRQEIIKILK